MEIQKLDSRSSHLVSTEPLARLILRAVALASSKIENPQMNAGRLLGHSALDGFGISRRIDGTEEAARNAVATLCNADILKQNSRNRKSNLFVATDVLDAFTFYERRLASPAGDTAQEKPSRPAPQKPRH